MPVMLILLQVQNMGHGGREMGKLRGACRCPPTECSSVPSTDVQHVFDAKANDQGTV
jgi:hypothetical protein